MSVVFMKFTMLLLYVSCHTILLERTFGMNNP